MDEAELGAKLERIIELLEDFSLEREVYRDLALERAATRALHVSPLTYEECTALHGLGPDEDTIKRVIETENRAASEWLADADKTTDKI